MKQEPRIHKSVMADEAILSLHVKNQAKYIDATLGTGGHSMEILKKGGTVMGIDMDERMITISQERLKRESLDNNFISKTGNFSSIDIFAKEVGWETVSGILFDLGVSNLQLKDLERGFSFAEKDAELDMRLNNNLQGVKASDLLNVLREDQLEKLFNEVLDRSAARWITKRILKSRELQRFQKVGDFLQICTGIKTGRSGLNEATLPFLALRMAVNTELDNLEVALPKAFKLLEAGGRLIVITFHSGEDGVVNKFIKETLGIKMEGILRPKQEEIYENQRSRSAKMYLVKKE